MATVVTACDRPCVRRVIWDGMGLVAKRIERVPHSDPPEVVLKSLHPE